MRFPISQRPILRAVAVFAATVAVGGLLWFEFGAKADGFAGYLDQRAAETNGIINSSEWRAMRAAGDRAAAAEGGDGCTTEACRTAMALIGGDWTGGGACNLGNRYRFTDAAAEIGDLRDGRVIGTNRRRYRVVSADVPVPVRRDGKGLPLQAQVTKRGGDVEVFTIGRQAYVRRIFRAVDQNTVMLVLVEERVGRRGPPHAHYVESRPTVPGPPLFYTRCPSRG